MNIIKQKCLANVSTCGVIQWPNTTFNDPSMIKWRVCPTCIRFGANDIFFFSLSLSLSLSFSYVKFSHYFVLFEKILKLICFLQFHPFIFLISYLIYILFIAIFLKFEKFTKIYFFFPVSSLNIKLIRNWASWFSPGIWFYVLCIWEINLGLRYFLGFAFFLFFFLSFFFSSFILQYLFN